MRAAKAASMLTSLVKVGLFGGRLDVSSQIHLLRAKIVSGLNNGRPIADHRHPRSSSAKKVYQTIFNNATRMIMGLKQSSSASLMQLRLEMGIWSLDEENDYTTLLFFHRLAISHPTTYHHQAFEREFHAFMHGKTQLKTPYMHTFVFLLTHYDLDPRQAISKSTWKTHLRNRINAKSTSILNHHLQQNPRLRQRYGTPKLHTLPTYLQVGHFKGRKYIVKARLGILGLQTYLHAMWPTIQECCPLCGAAKEDFPHFFFSCSQPASARIRADFTSTMDPSMNERISKGTVQERHFKALMFEPQSRGVATPLMQAYAKQLGKCLSDLWQNRKFTIKAPTTGNVGPAI